MNNSEVTHKAVGKHDVVKHDEQQRSETRGKAMKQEE
jgi:hypothetical protein